MKPMVIYHADCTDGFGAAFAFWKCFGDRFEYYPARHDKPAPDVTDREVFIVDFSYSYEQTVEMAKQARKVVILDHHKTAQESLGQLLKEKVVSGEFDMNRSGAVMTWDYLYGKKSDRPFFISYIQDRDLWRWQLPNSREISAWLSSFPQEFEVWDELSTTCFDDAAREGAAISRRHNQIVKDLVKTAFKINVGGYSVFAVNAPRHFASDVGHELSKMRQFGVTYHDSDFGQVYSLRSSNGFDVSEVAKMYGGGGHAAAAGFGLKHGESLEGAQA